MIEFHKDGDSMAIVTTAPDEDTFVVRFSDALEKMIDEGKYDGDWSFQLQYWLRNFVDICAAYRGYKVDVIEQKTLTAGRLSPSSVVFIVDSHGRILDTK